MSNINLGRVIAGGLVAGVVTNLGDFAVNAPLLGAQWDDGLRGLGLDPAQNPYGALGWIASDFLFGFIMVWFYAAIRPRFGPGVGTAVLAAVAVWATARIAYLSFGFLGLFATDLVIASAIGALVAWVIGGVLGAAVYREG